MGRTWLCKYKWLQKAASRDRHALPGCWSPGPQPRVSAASCPTTLATVELRAEATFRIAGGRGQSAGSAAHSEPSPTHSPKTLDKCHGAKGHLSPKREHNRSRERWAGLRQPLTGRARSGSEHRCQETGKVNKHERPGRPPISAPRRRRSGPREQETEKWLLSQGPGPAARSCWVRRGCVHVGLLLARGRKGQGDEEEVWVQPLEESKGWPLLGLNGGVAALQSRLLWSHWARSRGQRSHCAGAHQDRDRWRGVDKHSSQWSQTPKPPFEGAMQTKGTQANFTTKQTAGTGGETRLAAADAQYPTYAHSLLRPPSVGRGRPWTTRPQGDGRGLAEEMAQTSCTDWLLRLEQGRTGEPQLREQSQVGTAASFPSPHTREEPRALYTTHVKGQGASPPPILPVPEGPDGGSHRPPRQPTSAPRALTGPHLAKRPL